MRPFDCYRAWLRTDRTRIDIQASGTAADATSLFRRGPGSRREAPRPRTCGSRCVGSRLAAASRSRDDCPDERGRGSRKRRRVRADLRVGQELGPLGPGRRARHAELRHAREGARGGRARALAAGASRWRSRSTRSRAPTTRARRSHLCRAGPRRAGRREQGALRASTGSGWRPTATATRTSTRSATSPTAASPTTASRRTR